VVCLVTLVIAALGEFTTASWRRALLGVLWRMATIAAGGAVAFTVSNVIAPECALRALRVRASACAHMCVFGHCQ
jgi:hypothetical protein